MKKLLFVLFVAIAINSVALLNSCAADYTSRTELPPDHPDSIQKCFEEWDSAEKEYLFNLCSEKDLNPYIMAAVIYNESNFVSTAIGENDNGTHDYGYFQVNDACFSFLQSEIGLTDMEELLDPYTNILAGCTIMEYHKTAVQDDELAVIRYQVGEGAYARLRRRGITTTPLQQDVLHFKNLIEINN